MDIIVPYKEDSPARAANKNKFFNHYKKYFNIVCVEDYDERHQVFNDAAADSLSEYIALTDIDAIIPIEQINMALFKMEQGADVVYPFDYIINRAQDGRHYDNWPAGFIYGMMVIFNRKKFIEFGGENSNFIGYGWEDYERYYRALNAGYKVERVPGYCYHMMHPRNGFENPYFNHNMKLMKREKKKWQNSILNSDTK